MKKLTMIALVIGCQFLAAPVQAVDAGAIELGERGIRAYQQGDIVTAMNLLQQSAQQGYAPAQATFGYLLDKSDFDDQAYHWYQQAAEQGDAGGQFGLARLLANGEGVKKDTDRALDWLRKAVAQQHPPAMAMYATALESAQLGLRRDEAQAVALFQACHDAGEAACTLRLVAAHRNGELGLAVDENKSAELYNSIRSPKKVE